MSYFYDYLIVVTGVISAAYVQSLIFVIFKANEYEDSLAKKIIKEIDQNK